MCKGDRVELDDLPAPFRQEATAAALVRGTPRTHDELKEAKTRAIELVEKRFLLESLRKAGGNVTEAARASGMLRTQFQNMLRKHGLFAKTRRMLLGSQRPPPLPEQDESA